MVGLWFVFFFFKVTATTEIYTLSLHDALPISQFTPRPKPQDFMAAHITILQQLADQLRRDRATEPATKAQVWRGMLAELAAHDVVFEEKD